MSTTIAKPRSARPTTEDDITAEVLRRVEATPDPRTREIMLSLLKHLHAFIKEVRLTEPEWWKGIDFLTRTGHMCDDRRQEFILLSDTLGVSMVTDLMSNRKPAGATESTVFGPFHRDGAPEMPFGGDIASVDRGGVTTIVSGRVLDLDGKPIAGALLDVWQVSADALYDSQDDTLEQMNMRGLFRTDSDGRYQVRTKRPVHYQIPSDGPVGELLRATNRHPWRPAHTHFVISAEGYEPVTTHLFDSIDPYLNEDAVFGVKDSLIVKFEEHNTRDEAAKKYGIEPPFCTTEYDFVVAPARAK
jgi:protocatechuate 3,4-dioxygenase beta subunit